MFFELQIHLHIFFRFLGLWLKTGDVPIRESGECETKLPSDAAPPGEGAMAPTDSLMVDMGPPSSNTSPPRTLWWWWWWWPAPWPSSPSCGSIFTWGHSGELLAPPAPCSREIMVHTVQASVSQLVLTSYSNTSLTPILILSIAFSLTFSALIFHLFYYIVIIIISLWSY